MAALVQVLYDTLTWLQQAVTPRLAATATSEVGPTEVPSAKRRPAYRVGPGHPEVVEQLALTWSAGGC